MTKLRSTGHSDSSAECTEGTEIWRWTRFRIAIILRTDPQHIQTEWTVRPSFHFWPPQRHGAILCILTHVLYRIQHRNRVSPTDFAYFMRRARWKAYHTAPRQEKLGITWRYFNIRHTPTGSATFHPASEHGVPAPDL